VSTGPPLGLELRRSSFLAACLAGHRERNPSRKSQGEAEKTGGAVLPVSSSRPRELSELGFCSNSAVAPVILIQFVDFSCHLSRYTHRVAISNSRLVAADDAGVAFRWKDYRIDSPRRWKTMRLHPHEFIRRFLMHVLPRGFHRIRHYGLFANASRAENIAKARALLGADPPPADPQPEVAPDGPRVAPCPCPRCGARMIVIEVFARGCEPRWRPTPGRFDTS
jgi:Putative transposase